MAEPVFLVTQFQEQKRPTFGNVYTGFADTDTMWKVGLVSGTYVGVNMAFYFDTEPEASHFSLWQIYRPHQIMDTLGTAYDPFVVQDVFQQPQWMAPNPYTGFRQKQMLWKAAMVGKKNALFEVVDPSQNYIRRFKIGSGLDLHDIFGLMPSAPADVAQELETQATEARQAQADAQQAQADAAAQFFAASELIANLQEQGYGNDAAALDEQAQAQLDVAEAASRTVTAKSINTIKAALSKAQGFLTKARKDKTAAIALSKITPTGEVQDALSQVINAVSDINSAIANITAILKALQASFAEAQKKLQEIQAQQAAQALRLAEFNASWKPWGYTIQSSDRLWTITNGGVTGYYDGVYFRAGTFVPGTVYFYKTDKYDPVLQVAGKGTWLVAEWFGTFSLDGVHPITSGQFTESLGGQIS